MSTTGPVTFSALLTAATFTVSFDILPGAQTFVVKAVCPAGTATINIYPGDAWQATYIVPSSLARAWNFAGDGFVVTDFLSGSPFPGNIIPASRVDPIAASAVSDLSLPNVTGGTGANGSWSASGNLPSSGHFAIGTSSYPPPTFGGFINLSSAGAQSTTFSLYVDGQLVASKQISFAAGAPQTITFGALPNQLLGAASFTVSATGGGSGNPVTFTSTTTNVCTVSGTNGANVTLIAGGTCTIQANQAGNATYAPATPVTQSFAVVAPPVLSQAFSAPSITLGATVSLGVTITNPNPATALTGVVFNDTLPAGLTVAGSSSSVCGGQFATKGSDIVLTGATISGGSACSFSVTVTGAVAGNYTNTSRAVTSSNGGTGNTATSVLVVLTPQTISFLPPSNQPLGAASFTLSATGGGSGNPVTFTSTTTNVCTVSGTNGAKVTLIAAGTCTIQANQAGNATYAAATPVTQSFLVVAPPVLSQAFSPTSVAVGATVSLAVTITNPNSAIALTGVGYSDALPAGLTLAVGSSPVCGGQLATNASGAIGLIGATISGGSVCSFNVTVTGAVAGNYTDTSGPVTSANGGTGNTASAVLSVASLLPPGITAYSPTSVPAGSAAFTLTLSGANFCPLSQVLWNTVNLQTTYSSPSSVSAVVPANLLTAPATAFISVVNLPGGCAVPGTSPAISFVVASVSSSPNPAVTVQPPLFRPKAASGSTTPVMNSVNIRNVNGTPLTVPLTAQVFTVSGGPNWLTVIPQTATDQNNGILRFTANPTGLAQGSYLGYIVYPGLSGNAGSAGSKAKPRDVTTPCNQVSTAVVFTVGNPVLTFNPIDPKVPATALENTISVTVNALSGQGVVQNLPMLVTATTNDGAGAPCWLSIAPLNSALQTGMAFQATASTANLPAGMHIGGLSVQAGGMAASDAVVFQNGAPGQQYLDAGTNPVITIDPNTLAGSIQVASVPASLPLSFTATCNGCAGASLAATCGGSICSTASGQIGGMTPVNLTVTITDLSLFDSGQASVTFSSPLSLVQSVTVPVALAPLMLVSDGIVTSGQTRLAVPGAGASVTVTVASGCPWLAVSQDSNVTPFNANLSVNPTGLSAGTYTCSLLATPASPGSSPVSVPVSLNLQATTVTQAVIPQIADGLVSGASWTTTITLVNLDSSQAVWNLTFYDNAGGPLNLGWTDRPSPSNVRTGTLPPGGTQTLQTNGLSPSLAEGWAQLTSSNRVSGNAIFAWNGQEAAVPILRTTQPTLYFPFDNNPGLSLGVAIAVPQVSSVSEASNWSQFNQNGVALTSPQNLTLAANGYDSFNLPPASTAPANLRGVAQFNALSDPAFGLGIRGRTVGATTAFTSIEALYTQPDTVQTISHVADGATWKTTIILVNTDSVPATYTVNFWLDNGAAFALPILGASTASTVTGTIPVGGTATIESSGTAMALTWGWAEVLSGQSVSGTAVFQYQATGQEAAVPFLSSGGNKLVFPFDTTNKLALGIALANPSVNTGALVTMTILDSSGNRLGSTSTIAIPSHGHYAGNPAIPLNQRGTLEFDSPNVPIYGLGIRLNGSAFTSIRALPK